jgi:hypothetical protein
LKSTFSEIIGTTQISADCYFGLGWQWSDFHLALQKHKLVLLASEALRRLSDIVWPIRIFADSVFCIATKPRSVWKPFTQAEEIRRRGNSGRLTIVRDELVFSCVCFQ